MIKSQIPKSIQQEFECSLCVTFFNFPTTIQCGHTFCKDCILQAIKQHPRCPICRSTITININNLKENLLIKSTVREIKKYLNIDDTKQQQCEEQKIDTNQKQQSLLYFYTNDVIVPCQYQRIELIKSQFKNMPLTPDFIKQMFQNVKQIVIANEAKNKSNMGYLAQLQLVQLVKGRILAQVLIEQLVQIDQYGKESFSVTSEGYTSEIQLYQAKITPIDEELIDLNDHDTAFQIKSLVQEIKEILYPFIQQLINSQNELSNYLHQSGLVLYLTMEIEKDFISLQRFSYLLPSLLNINKDQKQNILLENCCTQRLFLVNRSIQKFRNTTNPMAVFRLNKREDRKAFLKFFWPIFFALMITYLFRVL